MVSKNLVFEQSQLNRYYCSGDAHSLKITRFLYCHFFEMVLSCIFRQVVIFKTTNLWLDPFLLQRELVISLN